MGYVEIHFGQANQSVAQDLSNLVEDRGHHTSLVCRDKEGELRNLSHFISFHAESDSRLFFVADAATFNATWMNREVEQLVRLLVDEDERALSAVSMLLVGETGHGSFPLRGESIATFQLEHDIDCLPEGLITRLPKSKERLSKVVGDRAKFKGLADLHHKHKEFVNTICSNSTDHDFLVAIREWEPRHIGYSSVKHTCQLCGSPINYFARIANNNTNGQLTVGLVCYRRLNESLAAEGLADAFRTEGQYRQRQRSKVINKVHASLARSKQWQLPGIDYGSWRQWFLDMDKQGKLSDDLQEGLNELKHIGVVGSDAVVDQFIEFHNEHRLFPVHVLIPSSRLRGWNENPDAIPLSVTVNQARDLLDHALTKREYADFLVSRIADLFQGNGAPRELQLKMGYNYVMSVLRRYQGCRNDTEREQFIQSHATLSLNPEFIGSRLKKRHMDLGIANYLMLFAELLVLILEEEEIGNLQQPYMRMLRNRLERIAVTGRVSPAWPLATQSPQVDDKQAVKGGSRRESETKMFDRMDDKDVGMSPEADDELGRIVNEEWERVTGFPPLDVRLSGAWILSGFLCSDVAGKLGRTHFDLSIGLNDCWRRATDDELRAMIRVMLRDVCQDLHDRSDLTIAQRFLAQIDLTPLSQKDLACPSPDMDAIELLREMFNFDFEERIDREIAPNVVVWDKQKTPRYFRWGHVVMFPASYFSTLPAGKKRASVTRTFSQMTSVAPSSFKPYKRPKSRPAARQPWSIPAEEEESPSGDEWFAFNAAWITPRPQTDPNEAPVGWLRPLSPPLRYRASYPSGETWSPKIKRTSFLALPEEKYGRQVIFYERDSIFKNVDSVICIEVLQQRFRVTLEQGAFPLEILDSDKPINQGESLELDCGHTLRWPPIGLEMRFY